MATRKPKPVVAVIADKDFDVLLKGINKQSESLALDLHTAGLYCINQVNLHNNAGYAQRLIEAIGDKQDIRRIGKWLTTFGKLGVKKNQLVFKKRKDITPANVDEWLRRANETPYWALTQQPKLEVTYDYLAMLSSILSRASNVGALEEEGKTVTEKNVGVLDEVKKILLKYTPTEEQQEVKNKAQIVSDRTKQFTEPMSAH